MLRVLATSVAILLCVYVSPTIAQCGANLGCQPTVQCGSVSPCCSASRLGLIGRFRARRCRPIFSSCHRLPTRQNMVNDCSSACRTTEAFYSDGLTFAECISGSGNACIGNPSPLATIGGYNFYRASCNTCDFSYTPCAEVEIVDATIHFPTTRWVMAGSMCDFTGYNCQCRTSLQTTILPSASSQPPRVYTSCSFSPMGNKTIAEANALQGSGTVNIGAVGPLLGTRDNIDFYRAGISYYNGSTWEHYTVTDATIHFPHGTTVTPGFAVDGSACSPPDNS